MMDLLLLSIYILIPPGRALEIRTLQIVMDTAESTESLESNDGNFVIIKQDGSVVLIYNAYKTAKHYGRDVTVMKVCTFIMNPLLNQFYSLRACIGLKVGKGERSWLETFLLGLSS